MELIGKFKLDELGRILIPNQLRTLLGWELGDEIEMHYDGGCRAVLQLAKEKGGCGCRDKAFE